MPSLLITGVNRGIGLALARVALARGWSVLGSVRKAGDGEALKDRLGDGFTPLVFDVTDHDAVRAAAARSEAPLDGLINNAGIIGPDPEHQTPSSMDFSGFARTLEVNTLAPLAVAQAFLPRLRKAKAGRILTISSQMSMMGYAGADHIAYRASKAAVNKVMQGLATELRDEGIAVALINPGWVRTDMGGEAAELPPESVAEGIIHLIETLPLEQSGRLLRWSGQPCPF